MKSRMFFVLVTVFCFNLQAQTSFKSTAYNYGLTTPLGFKVTKKSGFDYFSSLNSNTISVAVKKLSAEGSTAQFDEGMTNEVLLAGYRKTTQNPRILQRGVEKVNGNDYFFVNIKVGTSDQAIMKNVIFFKGNYMYTLIMTSSDADLHNMRDVFRGVVDSFTFY